MEYLENFSKFLELLLCLWKNRPKIKMKLFTLSHPYNKIHTRSLHETTVVTIHYVCELLANRVTKERTVSEQTQRLLIHLSSEFVSYLN